MIRDREEVERAIDLESTDRVPIAVDGPERYGFTSREPVRIFWGAARRVGRRVEREAGVDVHVAEQRFAERCVIQTGLARFTVLNRMIRWGNGSVRNFRLGSVRLFAATAR